MPRYWLVKSEPHVYSIRDLERDRRTGWEGVRNYQARNLMRDDMSVGERVLYYHSSADVIGVAGLAEVVGAARPDPSQFDPQSPYFDEKSTVAEPRWWMVDVGFVAAFASVVTLDALKADPALEGMLVLRKGQRLSVQPVEEAHFLRVLALAGFTP